MSNATNVTNTASDNKDQKICKFTVMSIKDPKQEFEICQLVPAGSRTNDLVKHMERELVTKLSGFRVARLQMVDLQNRKKELYVDQESRKDDDQEFSQESEIMTASRLSGTEEYVAPSLPKLNGVKSKLDELSGNILELAGIKTLIFVDKGGKAIYRRVRESAGSGFDTDTVRIGTIAARAFLLLKTAIANDPDLGETQFVVVGRKEFKSIFVLIQPLDIVLRVTVDKNAEARAISDQIQAIISEYYPKLSKEIINHRT